MTIYRATIYDTPTNPFEDAQALRALDDGALLVTDGVIRERGPYRRVREQYPREECVDLSEGILLPGFVDTHVHYPQIRAIGGLGMPLLDWLERCALPEEMRLADRDYAAAVADEFLKDLAYCGTTTALVFGAHFPEAMEVFFEKAHASGLNITAGLTVSDRLLPPELLATPQQALHESGKLIERWHGRGSIRYAVTPRFSLSTTDQMLAVCGELMQHEGVWFTSHINENTVEVQTVKDLFPGSQHYLDSYLKHGLITDRSVLAHNVHASEAELAIMGQAKAWTAHCPTSNSALGSGLFPLAAHLRHGVGVALGSDVGAGTGLFIPKEGLQAYFMQQLLHDDGYPLSPAHLLYLATAAGAKALGRQDVTGDLSVGKRFDAVLLHPDPASTLAINLAAATSPADALARIFALASAPDVTRVWANGREITAS